MTEIPYHLKGELYCALYQLLRIPSVDDFLEYDLELVSEIFYNNIAGSKSRSKGIIEAIERAVQNPGIDFNKEFFEIEHSNNNIYRYLKKILYSVKRDTVTD